MLWFVNDLSLAGQFDDPKAFRAALEPLLRLRHGNPSLGKRLYCTRGLGARPVTDRHDLRDAVFGLGDRTFTQLVLNWVTKQGPFWDDERQPNADDLFEHEGQDVTDQGLGEAARRMLAGADAGVFSFAGKDGEFERTPLAVTHGLPEAPLGSIGVENWWTTDGLRLAAEAAEGVPENWSQVIERAEARFQGLLLAGDLSDRLCPHPFSVYVAQRIIELLGVLDRMVAETDEQGRLSERGVELRENHFVGQKAWFTSESETNLTRFEADMTFRDPADHGKTIFCPWHGKIKTPQFRIHFEWPRPEGQREIKVVYIGPKITKR